MGVSLGPASSEIQSWPSHPTAGSPAHRGTQVLVRSAFCACDQHHISLKPWGLPPMATYTDLLDASVSFQWHEGGIPQIERSEEK